MRLARSEVGTATERKLDRAVVPLINVVFLLLMFFLVAGENDRIVHTEGVPPVSSSVSPVDAGLGRLIVLDNGKYSWEDTEFSLEEIENQLPAARAGQSGLTVWIGRNAESRQLLQLFDPLRALGYTQVEIVTLLDDEW